MSHHPSSDEMVPLSPNTRSSGAPLLGTDAPACARRLVDVVSAATPRLLAIGDAQSARRPAPGKWSPREIIGHLVDSATNNHQRFVRMARRDDLVMDGYAQDEWVALQNYQDAPWEELVAFWRLYNRHLARVMGAIDETDRAKPRAIHNLDERGFHAVSRDQPVTLEQFMSDYIDHLEHHLRQVLR